MKEISLNGSMTVEQHRQILDKQSGIPGLPGLIVHEPTEEDQRRLKRMQHFDPSARFELTPTMSLIDGTVELVPTLVIPPAGDFKTPIRLERTLGRPSENGSNSGSTGL